MSEAIMSNHRPHPMLLIVRAEDILTGANSLAWAICMAAETLESVEATGAVSELATTIRDRIADAIELLDRYREAQEAEVAQ